MSIRNSVNITVSVVKQYYMLLHTERYAEPYVTAVSTPASGSRGPEHKVAFEADYPVGGFSLFPRIP